MHGHDHGGGSRAPHRTLFHRRGARISHAAAGARGALRNERLSWQVPNPARHGSIKTRSVGARQACRGRTHGNGSHRGRRTLAVRAFVHLRPPPGTETRRLGAECIIRHGCKCVLPGLRHRLLLRAAASGIPRFSRHGSGQHLCESSLCSCAKKSPPPSRDTRANHSSCFRGRD